HIFPMSQIVSDHIVSVQPGRGVMFGPDHRPQKFRRELEKICKAAETRVYTPHDFRRASITYWSTTESTAGQLIHGCGLEKIMGRYLDPLQVLNAAKSKFPWPIEIREAKPEMKAPERTVPASMKADWSWYVARK